MAPGQGFRHATIVDTNPDVGDEYLIRIDGFTQPPVLAYGQAAGPAARLVRQEPESFDATGVEVTQHFVASDDGTQVPYFVVGQAGGPTATLLTGYGGYQVSLTPAYDPLIGRGWLARGGTYVVANIRGGGEYGPAWHKAAMREHRVKAYQDFAAVARDLVIRGVTTVPQLGIMGRSNGGLLVGAMLAGYPELFGAVACAVPLLDLRRYHQLLAGASWIAEYGDPDQPDDWAYLSQFSPYHQVRPDRSYPPVLLLTSTRDDRVHPGHARKMAARLGEYGHRVTYYENIDGGHAGAADNASTAHHWALILDFLWRHLAVST
jgi:prolyl oligopeptidase